MKKLVGSLCIGLIFLLPTDFGDRVFLENRLGFALESIRNTFIADLEEFEKKCIELDKIAQLYLEDQVNDNELQLALSHTRIQYKKLEYLFEYLQPEYTKKYINGAPLPKTDPTIPGIEIIAPCGLQTLDELVYSDEARSEAKEIARLAIKLSQDLKTPKKYLKAKNLEHRYVLEAIREELIRVFALGLTGFDTPGSANAIPEAESALQSIRNALGQYEEIFGQKDLKIGIRLMDLLGEWIAYLQENQDFDTLNRLHILTEYFNPLYEGLYDLHKSLNVEFKHEVDPTLHAVNYNSRTIFSEKFLNPSYYSQISSVDLFDPKKIVLGKKLFFDPSLSLNSDMSCATCHQPEKAFTDGKKTSIEKEGVLSRNAPGLINSVYYGHYFWDMREYDLERQVKHVMYNEDEFNIDFLDLTDRLKENKEYRSLFDEAYGDRDKYLISTWSISNALAAYVSSLSSWNSDFDRYARGEKETLDASVERGFNLFMGKAACGTCHFAPSFSGIVPPRFVDSESEVLGILTAFDTINPSLDDDPGRQRNKLPRDEVPHFNRSFKTMTVRNVEFTAPYMHNGSIESLEDLMVFYNKGGGAGLGLEVDHQTLAPDPLNLNQQEMNDIISFMKSLSDTTGFASVNYGSIAK